jgi:hypothetical protein
MAAFKRRKKADNETQAEKPAKKEKTRKVKRVKPAKKGGRKRFVFFIGDEGAILSYVEGKTVLRRLFAPSGNPDSRTAFEELLESDPKSPISILVDMMDQSYVRQTFPPVPKMSLPKLVKRRLDRDFAPEDIKGSLFLGREEGGRKDWNYLLISLANSPALMDWLEYALEKPNLCTGIYLVPVEAEQFIKALGEATIGKEHSEWQLLVSHHKVGGFRQVILKNGRLTFTRLAQPIGDSAPAVIAGNIEQEVQNTIEYLKRLGYTEQSGLDTFIICSSGIKESIAPDKLFSTHVNLFTPAEAADVLELEKAAMPEDHYGDVVFSSFFAQHKKKVLPLHTRKSQKLKTMQSSLDYIKWGSIATAAALLLFAIYNVVMTFPLKSDISDLEGQRNTAQQQLNVVKTEKQGELTPDELNVISDVVSIYETFSNQEFHPLTFIEKYAGALQEGEAHVNTLEWTSADSLLKRAKNEQELVKARIELQFIQKTGPLDPFLQMANALIKRVKDAFPGYKMTSSKLPGMLDADETFQATFTPESGGNSAMLDGNPVVVTLEFENLPSDGTAPAEGMQ